MSSSQKAQIPFASSYFWEGDFYRIPAPQLFFLTFSNCLLLSVPFWKGRVEPSPPQCTRKHGRRNLGQVSGVCEEEGNSNHRKREIKIVLEKMLSCNTSFCCSRFWFSFRGNSFPLLCSTLTLPREEKGGGDHKVNVRGNSVAHSRRGGGYRRKVVHLWDWR